MQNSSLKKIKFLSLDYKLWLAMHNKTRNSFTVQNIFTGISFSNTLP